MAPVVAVNIPNVKHGKHCQVGVKPGTVGHPLPGVAVKVVHPVSGEALPCGTEGLLLLKGPNRMLGYLGQPDATADVLRDAWYVTGDIASIDADGFIRITDRLARFSKIAGEMVPHIKVEEVLNSMLGNHSCIVTAIPDAHRGEQLRWCFIHARRLQAMHCGEQLRRSGLPKLWLPKRQHFFYLEAIPTLASGKADLRQAKAIALQKGERRLSCGTKSAIILALRGGRLPAVVRRCRFIIDTVTGLVILTGRLLYTGLILTGFGRMEGVDGVACRDDCYPVAATGLAFGAG